MPICVDERVFKHRDVVIDHVESKVFDFDQFLTFEGMGVKKYHDSLYLGQYKDNK